ncbi:hypothetical protein C0Q70_13833 [Pomacea canaliculata]|uniref:Uncharacterized protein n=1 Tax=Pomacea canaliculata TaxID=400727 RepID=A0A2T7NYD5_POMCA|nr:hypothetical protein C0Q70_13833 [Pomacea canaliculata]
MTREAVATCAETTKSTRVITCTILSNSAIWDSQHAPRSRQQQHPGLSAHYATLRCSAACRVDIPPLCGAEPTLRKHARMADDWAKGVSPVHFTRSLRLSLLYLTQPRRYLPVVLDKHTTLRVMLPIQRPPVSVRATPVPNTCLYSVNLMTLEPRSGTVMTGGHRVPRAAHPTLLKSSQLGIFVEKVSNLRIVPHKDVKLGAGNNHLSATPVTCEELTASCRGLKGRRLHHHKTERDSGIRRRPQCRRLKDLSISPGRKSRDPQVSGSGTVHLRHASPPTNTTSNGGAGKSVNDVCLSHPHD